jgi:hypothetical protein
LFAVAAAACAMLRATGPLADVDVFWHVRLGDRILRTHSVPTREPWDFPAVGRHWVPHSWLSDVALAVTHRIGGWNGVVALRLALSVALLVLVARAVLRGTDPLAGPLVYAAVALALSPNLLDRPQLFALVLVAALLPLFDRARTGVAPHPLVAAALGWLWASLHGSWPLLPLALCLAAACVRVDRRRGARALLLAAAAAVAGAALTPVGPALLVRPYVVARASYTLNEWQPTAPMSPFGVAYTVLLATLAVSWARSARVEAGELVWAGAIALGGLLAWRNVGFATLLLAPVVARRLSAVVPAGRRSEIPRWALATFAGVAATTLVALAVASPTFPDDAPTGLLATLRAQPGEIRLLDDYNVGGLVTGLGGPHVSAAVDGRIDAFPPGFLARYGQAVTLRGDWSGLLAELRPTHALLQANRPLTHVLETERGWRRLGADRTYVLLAAP